MKHKGFILGPLPADQINKALGLELEPGDVYCSAGVHHKIATKHQDDYQLFLQQFPLCLASPAYVGQPPKHLDKIELVRRFRSAGKVLLLAITLEKNSHGNYALASAYTIREEQVETRKQAKTLVILA